jgi:hypothetical protein
MAFSNDIWEKWGQPVASGPTSMPTAGNSWLTDIFQEVVGFGRDWLGAETQLEIARINRDASLAANASPGDLPGVDAGSTYGAGGFDLASVAIWGGVALVAVVVLRNLMK